VRACRLNLLMVRWWTWSCARRRWVNVQHGSILAGALGHPALRALTTERNGNSKSNGNSGKLFLLTRGLHISQRVKEVIGAPDEPAAVASALAGLMWARLGSDMPTSLSNFGLYQMLACSSGVRVAMDGAGTMERAAQRAIRFFYDELVDDSGKRACVLARVYRTQPFATLPPDVKAFASRMLPDGDPHPGLRCLTLLATHGERPSWNERRRSIGHQAIPLLDAAVVERAPMIAAMIRAFGLDIAAAVAPDTGLTRDLEGKTYGVFHVADADESPHIPAKDFVRQHSVRSVIGFGGSLPDGDLFATLLFTRTTVDRPTAERFRTVALDMKSRFHSFDATEVFETAS
jgi:hypothetical protein